MECFQYLCKYLQQSTETKHFAFLSDLVPRNFTKVKIFHFKYAIAFSYNYITEI